MDTIKPRVRVTLCTFKVGDIVRYGKGPTALMQISHTHENHGRYGAHLHYGNQCIMATVGAYDADCTPASEEDLLTWAEWTKPRVEWAAKYSRN